MGYVAPSLNDVDRKLRPLLPMAQATLRFAINDAIVSGLASLAFASDFPQRIPRR